MRRRVEEAAAAQALPGETTALPAVGGRGRRAGTGAGRPGEGLWGRQGRARSSRVAGAIADTGTAASGRLRSLPFPPGSSAVVQPGRGAAVPGRGRPGQEVAAGVRRACVLVCGLTLRASKFTSSP